MAGNTSTQADGPTKHSQLPTNVKNWCYTHTHTETPKNQPTKTETDPQIQKTNHIQDSEGENR